MAYEALVIGDELFPTPLDKGSFVGSVIQRPLSGGNERTGLLGGAALLHLAGYELAAPRDEMVEVSVSVGGAQARGRRAVVMVPETR